MSWPDPAFAVDQRGYVNIPFTSTGVVSGNYGPGFINVSGDTLALHALGKAVDEMRLRIAKLEEKNEELEGTIAEQNEFIVTMWHHPTMPGGSNAIKAMEEKYKNKEHSENK